ncbi:hypothetical protein [Streptomyces sp. 2P-4]|uniref:hypothetical protein n=1 Tax=Streptomyces sp. 2P-4 TaxID=2931974 RepID=UPI002540D457|nr:hypothetical protein [Streptomyces sp. 2P-4]
MSLTPLAINDVAEAVLACVCTALDAAAVDVEGQPGCPDCRACLVPGQPAWDSCEDPCSDDEAGGQLSVSVVRTYPTSLEEFPSPMGEKRLVQGVRGCTPPSVIAVELLVTLLRCAPTMDENGCPPSCEELSRAARVLHVDMVTVQNALLCCLPGTSTRPRGRIFSLGQQRAVGPDGGCVGVEQRVTVALPGCRCPEES